jgi:poly-gamma-glutamate synthesis protein (capsule biosynthesis protein)
VVLAATGCASGTPAPADVTTPARTTAGAPARSGAPRPAASPSASGPAATAGGGPGGPAVLAFAGDVHFEGSSRAALSGRVGSAFGVLRDADLAMVNLETAITDRGTPQPKQFTFRAPAAAVGVLKQAGVDVVSVANNHGMDFGRVGLADTLAAAKATGLPLLGAGEDDQAAWTPLRRVVKGVKVSIVAATDVLDDFAQTAWVAGPGVSGLASAKDTRRLVETVRAERAQADVVVVFLHWGQERIVCPTARQTQLARLLADAGATVVVGSHAHVVQPRATVGRTLVDYGMGNFQFYAGGGPGAESGVLTVTVDRTGVRGSEWHPAAIVGGVPMLLTGPRAASRAAAEQSRFARC